MCRILLVDLCCTGFEHVPFNSAFVRIVEQGLPAAEIAFAGEARHCDNVAMELSKTNSLLTAVHPIEVANRDLRHMHRRKWDVAVVAQVLSEHNYRLDQIVILSCRFESLIGLRKLFQKRVSKAHVLHVIHGGLSRIRRRSRNPFLWRYDERSILRSVCTNGWRHVFLEGSSYAQAIGVIPELRDYSVVIQHPVPVDSSPVDQSFGSPIQLAFLGGCTEAKGFFRFLEAAEIGNTQYSGKFEFHVIGSSKSKIQDSRLKFLSTPPCEAKIGRSEFTSKLKGMHYILMPYSIEHYGWSPSGVLLDAIGYGVPIACTDIPLFSDLFRRYGNIGHIEGDSCEWGNNILNSIASTTELTFELQRKCVLKARDDRTTTKLSSQYALAIGSMVNG